MSTYHSLRFSLTSIEKFLAAFVPPDLLNETVTNVPPLLSISES